MKRIIVAMRGRNQQKLPNGYKQEQIKYEQRLEPNTGGVTNTLTNVTKDNLILEIKK